MHATGALHIDPCRIPYPTGKPESGWAKSGSDGRKGYLEQSTFRIHSSTAEEIQARVALGRWPVNLILEHTCLESCSPSCPVGALNEQGGERPGMPLGTGPKAPGDSGGLSWVNRQTHPGYGDVGMASRFFKVLG
jgi:hypothetical protein